MTTGSLTIDLQFTGDLPTNRAFDPSGNMLTHQVTIIDDDFGVAGWSSPTGTYVIGTGADNNIYTATARISRSPNRAIELGVSFSGTASRGADFFLPGAGNACSIVRWPAKASNDNLEVSCVLVINACATGKTIIMTLSDSVNHLMMEGGFSTTPAPASHAIMVSAPPSVSIDSGMSNNMLNENGGTANVVVSINELSP